MKYEQRAAFEEFYAANWRPLVGLLTAIGGDQVDAEEVAQEAFVRAIPCWPRVQSYESPVGWLRLVASRILISNMRKATTARSTWARLRTKEQHARAPTTAAVDLEAALATLAPSQRAVVLLHHVYDLPVDEIAEGLRLPAGTVKSQLARGRSRLQPLLTDYRLNLDT